MCQMYPIELARYRMICLVLEIKDTTESIASASCLDLILLIERDSQFHTSIDYKRDACNFHITKFPFLSSNIRGIFILWLK